MTCFVAGDESRPRFKRGNGGSAASRFKAVLWAYGRPRARKRVAARFAALDLRTLEDIGLLRTHITAACVSEVNDNDPGAAAPPLANGE